MKKLVDSDLKSALRTLNQRQYISNQYVRDQFIIINIIFIIISLLLLLLFFNSIIIFIIMGTYQTHQN